MLTAVCEPQSFYCFSSFFAALSAQTLCKVIDSCILDLKNWDTFVESLMLTNPECLFYFKIPFIGLDISHEMISAVLLFNREDKIRLNCRSGGSDKDLTRCSRALQQNNWLETSGVLTKRHQSQQQTFWYSNKITYSLPFTLTGSRWDCDSTTWSRLCRIWLQMMSSVQDGTSCYGDILPPCCERNRKVL